jgi:hypothetical protein
MKRIVVVCVIYGCFLTSIFAQSKAIQQKVKNQFVDSSVAAAIVTSGIDLAIGELNQVSDDVNTSQPFVPSVLNAGNHLFASTAAFHFGSRRYRLRGYAADHFQAFVNEVPMINLVDGSSPWNNWTGLNEIVNNSTVQIGLSYNAFGFGAMGSSTYLQLKASKLRPQTTLSFINGNRNYRYRFAFTKVVPMNKNGWAFAGSIGIRLGENVQMPGSFYQSQSFFLSVDKKIDQHLFSLTLLGNSIYSSRSSAITKELYALAGASMYSPNWGFQNDQKRNANMQKMIAPLLFLSHGHTSEDGISYNNSLFFSVGERSNTGLDWYRAADPRPDYYRYLPSFQNDSLLQLQVNNLFKNQPELLQINWQQMYSINKNSFERINDIDGIIGNNRLVNRSNYILEDRAELSKKWGFVTRLSQQVNERLLIGATIHYQWQQYRYFKKVNDLLGATNYVDWNHFADAIKPNDPSLQNDLNRPNRLLSVGDVFGYDYQLELSKLTAAGNISYQLNRFDVFAVLELAEWNFVRTGFMQNGVFSNNSFGKSLPNRFSTASFKTGITYKYNGRNYFYVNGLLASKAPNANDVFVSPRTRDTKQTVILLEKIVGLEAGYILNAPSLKLRINGYLSSFKDGMNASTFYHDGYKNLVNYLLWNIHQLHFGTEIAAEWQLHNRWRANMAIGAGKFIYTNQPMFSVAIDNEDYPTEDGIVYIKHFPIGGMPQQAYNVGFTYQSPSSFLLSINGNYLANYWLTLNPLRRTYEAVRNLPPQQSIASVTHPEKLPDLFVADLTAAYSFRVPTKIKYAYHFVQLFLSVNNLLNQSFITGGYEQLRYDIENANTQKFPSKYYYLKGLNYALSIRLRL